MEISVLDVSEMDKSFRNGPFHAGPHCSEIKRCKVSYSKCRRPNDCLVAPDFGEGFPRLPVVEGDEQEAGEGADERDHQRHDGHTAGRSQVGDAAERTSVRVDNSVAR